MSKSSEQPEINWAELSVEQHIDALTAENQRLREVLVDIENMPRYDQDDAHRLRHKAKTAKVVCVCDGTCPRCKPPEPVEWVDIDEAEWEYRMGPFEYDHDGFWQMWHNDNWIPYCVGNERRLYRRKREVEVHMFGSRAPRCKAKGCKVAGDWSKVTCPDCLAHKPATEPPEPVEWVDIPVEFNEAYDRLYGVNPKDGCCVWLNFWICLPDFLGYVYEGKYGRIVIHGSPILWETENVWHDSYVPDMDHMQSHKPIRPVSVRLRRVDNEI